MGEPIPALTGKGVRIAIIDSGVNPQHPHIAAARLAATASIARDGSVSENANDALDHLGHGTAVTAAIQEKAPEAELLIVRVFHDALKASAAALVAAIDWCVARDVDLINLSLGSTNVGHRAVFERHAAQAAAAGALLVAARSAGEEACYPGSLPIALGVELDWDCPRDCFRVQGDGSDPIYRASGYPRPIDGAPPRRNLYGVSFAVAQMTGFAARACEQIGSGARTGAREGHVRRQLELWGS